MFNANLSSWKKYCEYPEFSSQQRCCLVTNHEVGGKDIRIRLNGWVPTITWSVKNVNGKIIDENRLLSGLISYDYFLWIFPMNHLDKIVALTNVQLSFCVCSLTNGSEILKFLGTIVLKTRFQFGARRDLWISK